MTDDTDPVQKKTEERKKHTLSYPALNKSFQNKLMWCPGSEKGGGGALRQCSDIFAFSCIYCFLNSV